MPESPATILLAEDNALLRPLAATLLRRNGFEVLLAENGREALELFEQHRGHIDLLVLDLEMPELSGPEVLRRIQQQGPHVPALFTSGQAELPDELPAPVRVAGFVAKPYREHELVAAVRRALQQPR
jgi:CheY-like chemotaxis protein